MAVNVSKRKGNVKNQRSHALNATKKWQKLNKQVHRIEGIRKKISVKEIRTSKKNEKAA